MRLQRIKEEFGARVKLVWKSFLLHPEPEVLRPKPGMEETRRRLEEEGHQDGIRFLPWELRRRPSHSVPALVAAKCAALQGEEAFTRYHLRLLQANFSEGQDISRREVLLTLAQETGLDTDHFGADLDSGAQEPLVWQEDAEAHSNGFFVVPMAVFSGAKRIGVRGAVPVAYYLQVLHHLLGFAPQEASDAPSDA